LSLGVVVHNQAWPEIDVVDFMAGYTLSVKRTYVLRPDADVYRDDVAELTGKDMPFVRDSGRVAFTVYKEVCVPYPMQFYMGHLAQLLGRIISNP
jgi:hypothetical protein